MRNVLSKVWDIVPFVFFIFVIIYLGVEVERLDGLQRQDAKEECIRNGDTVAVNARGEFELCITKETNDGR